MGIRLMIWIKFFLKQFLSGKIFLPFIPFFVAFDTLGILPVFISLTADMEIRGRKKVVRQSVLTAFLVSIGFLVLGKTVFSLLEITVSDFKIAGGILLFILSIVELIFPQKTRIFPRETIGVVPIGIPLIVGPGVLTVLLMSVDSYGTISTILCLTINLLIVWFAFNFSPLVFRFLKEGGSKGMGKVFSLLLAAYAVMMIRTGIELNLCMVKTGSTREITLLPVA